MRILFALPYVPSLIRVRPYHFIRELARRHDVSVLAAAFPREIPNAEGLRALCQHVEVVPLRSAESLWQCGVAAGRGEPLQGAVCRSTAMNRRLTSLLSQHSFDVVHVEHFRAAYLGADIPIGVPTVFDSVDCISLLQERTLQSSHSLRQRIIARMELQRTKAYEGRVLRRFDQVLVTSTEDSRALQVLAPAVPITVVPNGVDLDHFRPTIGPRAPSTLVFSGKMSYHANVTAITEFVRNIFPIIREQRPDVRLRIVGSDPPRSVVALSSDPAISVTGFVPDMRGALGTATIAICPIKVKVGIQNKILEAMAMGLPVVCSREGAAGLEAVEGRDLLVSDSDAEFAEHVCELLDDAAGRNRLGEAGRAYVETHHRWSSVAHILESLYFSAMGSPALDPRLLTEKALPA